MKKLYGLCVFLSFCIDAASQTNTNYSKVGATLKMLMADTTAVSPLVTVRNGIKYIPVLIELDSAVTTDEGYYKKLGIRTRMGNVATADVALEAVGQLAGLNIIKRIELPLLFRKTDTVMRKMTRAWYVQNGTAPLATGYTGKNTIMGIIDDGFDFTHPDFNTPENKTRFVSIWNMDGTFAPPAGFTYGNEWLPDSLERYKQLFKNRQIGNFEMERKFGYSFHGTSVAGLAAGNNGIANGADLIGVALTAFGDTLLRSDRMLDAIKYIYTRAEQANKKCIINISLGIMDGGPHDGKTLVEKAIDDFCEEKPNILICSSAGNNGNTWKHWGGFPIHRDSSFFFFQCLAEGSLYFTIPRQFTNSLSLSFTDSKYGQLGRPDISKDSIIEQTPFINIGSIINSQVPVELVTAFPRGNASSRFTFSASHYNQDYDELVVKVNEYTSSLNNLDFHLYRFIWKGEGLVHCWLPFWNLHPVYFFDNNPLPNDSTYHISDNDYTTVIPSHARTILSSGAYNNRNCFIHMNRELVYRQPRCTIADFTSHGPTLDGRIKPDVITPGDNVLAPRRRFDDYYEHYFIVDTNTVSFGGTSASSPITAGIAALVWERFPLLTRDEVIAKIKSTANFDGFCQVFGTQPNNVTGMGKVDAFNAVAGIKLDNAAICNTADTCTLPLVPVIQPPVVLEDFFFVYPNPARDFINISYRSFNSVTYNLFDCTGRHVLQGNFTPPVSNQPATVQIACNRLAPGIYLLRLKSGNRIFTRRVMVTHS